MSSNDTLSKAKRSDETHGRWIEQDWACNIDFSLISRIEQSYSRKTNDSMSSSTIWAHSLESCIGSLCWRSKVQRWSMEKRIDSPVRKGRHPFYSFLDPFSRFIFRTFLWEALLCMLSCSTWTSSNITQRRSDECFAHFYQPTISLKCAGPFVCSAIHVCIQNEIGSEQKSVER